MHLKNHELDCIVPDDLASRACSLPVLAGLGLGFSLIIAIGAQNLFVLRQGLRREHVFVVAAICAVSDAVLIALGVSGIGLVLQAVPWLVDVVRWAGAAFLVTYGLIAARRAWRVRRGPRRLIAGTPTGGRTSAGRPRTARIRRHAPAARCPWCSHASP